MPVRNWASASRWACADGACPEMLCATATSAAIRTMVMAGLPGSDRWGLQILPQFRLIGIEFERSAEALLGGAAVAGAGFRQPQRGERRGIVGREPRGVPHV